MLNYRRVIYIIFDWLLHVEGGISTHLSGSKHTRDGEKVMESKTCWGISHILSLINHGFWGTYFRTRMSFSLVLQVGAGCIFNGDGAGCGTQQPTNFGGFNCRSSVLGGFLNSYKTCPLTHFVHEL